MFGAAGSISEENTMTEFTARDLHLVKKALAIVVERQWQIRRPTSAGKAHLHEA
jgi:hypothetical protein